MNSKRIIRKMHRWIGLIASIWLLLLASTGLLLQHSHDWNLNKTYIGNSFLLKSYGIGEQFVAFEQNNHQLTQLDKQLIQDNTPTIKLSENINSAIYHKSNWIIATNSQILWIDSVGEIIKTLDNLDGIPTDIKNLGLYNYEIYFKIYKKTYKLDDLSIKKNIESKIHWAKPKINNKLKKLAIQLTSENYLSYQQLIFDFHAGITTPLLINDIAALALIFLSLSGIVLFLKKRKTNSQTSDK